RAGAGHRRQGVARAGDLAGAGAALHLAHGFDDLVRAVHAAAAEAAGASVQRQLPVQRDASALGELEGFAGRAEAERLQPPVDEGAEPVVELGRADVTRAQPGALPEPAAELAAAVVDLLERPDRGGAPREALGVAADIRRRRRQIARPLGAGEDE